MYKFKWAPILFAWVTTLTGCAQSIILEKHGLYPAANDTAYAQVYLLRPQAQRSRGVADNPVNVEMGREKLTELAQGEYVLVHIKPGETDVVARNLTYITAKPMPIEVWRARHFDFEAGHVYYILMRQDYEEFRGIYFVPEALDELQARQLAGQMSAVGALAKKHPIASAQ